MAQQLPRRGGSRSEGWLRTAPFAGLAVFVPLWLSLRRAAVLAALALAGRRPRHGAAHGRATVRRTAASRGSTPARASGRTRCANLSPAAFGRAHRNGATTATRHALRTPMLRYAANAVLVVHFLFVLLATAGGVGLLVDPRWAWVHVPVVLWSSVVNLAHWTCPLTPLENRLRVAAGKTGYDGGFIQHYLGPLVYPQGMPRRLERVAGVAILAWNAVVYACIFWWLAR